MINETLVSKLESSSSVVFRGSVQELSNPGAVTTSWKLTLITLTVQNTFQLEDGEMDEQGLKGYQGQQLAVSIKW